MNKYTYKVLRHYQMSAKDLEKQLNELGGQGWAIIHVAEVWTILGRREEEDERQAEDGPVRKPAIAVIAVPRMNRPTTGPAAEIVGS